jgi:hypothetical protein
VPVNPCLASNSATRKSKGWPSSQLVVMQVAVVMSDYLQEEQSHMAASQLLQSESVERLKNATRNNSSLQCIP